MNSSEIKKSDVPYFMHTDIPLEDFSFDAKTLPENTPEVAVIGAGMAGLCSVYWMLRQLKQDANLSISIIDRRGIGEGASGRNAGIIWPKPCLFEDDLQYNNDSSSDDDEPQVTTRKHDSTDINKRLENSFDYNGFRKVIMFVQAMEKKYGETETKEGIDSYPSRLTPCIDLPVDKGDSLDLRDYCKHVEKYVHMQPGDISVWNASTLLQATGVSQSVPGPCAGLYMRHAAQVNPRWIMSCLYREIKAYVDEHPLVQVRWYLNHSVDSLSYDLEQGTCLVNCTDTKKQSKCILRMSKVLMTTNAYTPELLPAFRDIITPIHEQAFLTTPVHEDHILQKTGAILNQGAEGSDLYMRAVDNNRFLVGGMRESQSSKIQRQAYAINDGVIDKAVNAGMMKRLNILFPGMKFQADKTWAGCYCTTPDKVPLMGSLRTGILLSLKDQMHSHAVRRDQLFVSAGFNGDGMTRCFAAGEYIAKCIAGTLQLDEILHRFAPQRFQQLC